MMYKFLGLAVAIFLMLIVAFAHAEEPCYKDAPKPVYDAVKGYGWSETVPCDKTYNKYSIIKAWSTDGANSREVFLDVNKDGECDTVLHFVWNGRYNEDGRKLFERLPNLQCTVAEHYIQEFLHERGGDD